ncbi:hypothetical protein N7507_007067 [Penicillium longicatenatum]|nr:hypothetical protein N7507_007067 [Penicillium longicatenatum]
MRPIFYAFDPSGTTSFVPPKYKYFSFLSDSLTQSIPGLENTESIDPRAKGVPWPTSFPACLQCKYWHAADDAATELIHQIEAAQPERQGLLPSGMQTQIGSTTSVTKREELILTSATASINMFPAASKDRVKIIAKANMLIFIHDDVIESGYADTGVTIIENVTFDQLDGDQQADKIRLCKNDIWRQYVKEVLEEDPIIGPELLGGIIKWAEYTRVHTTNPRMRYNTFGEYVEFRIRDFAVEFINAALKLSCRTPLTVAEMEPLESLHTLYITHFSLTNDLYSYGKEYLEMQKSGSALINGVKVLQDLLCVPADTAKVLLRSFLLVLESQIHDAYEALIENGDVNTLQLRFARGMIESLAGNTFYSATCFRYARVVPGSALNVPMD